MFQPLYFFYWYIRTIPFRKYFFFPKVLGIGETIFEIANHKKSISRFGDGEFRLILPNENLKFQEENQLLTERLKEVLTSDLENHLVAIPESFQSVKAFKLNVKYWWIDFINKYGNQLAPYFKKDKSYGNAFISRFYLDYKDKSQVQKNIRNLKKIWEGKDILIVEGEYSRLGIGNDLFDNTASLQRILCPSKNAFSKYNAILEMTKKLGENKLILIALGPTATVLSYDLALAGFWAVDIGHVDIEYSWYLEKAEYKIPVKYRLVNESTNQDSIDLPDNLRESYLNSIIYKIEE
ncbi:glycosyl transferase [Cloacibacterium rupense]|uniref:Glycosyl transferase n=1 Tax=Cloacibacterium rupense TaxID=517423 RepID=A0ABQ2NN00_9FLAO|nr:SP_1767 family glycosyltransferase [Cloacibacterium rupense]GGP05323.1 glycosyl transferase [Cloacibacterium rupense]